MVRKEKGRNWRETLAHSPLSEKAKLATFRRTVDATRSSVDCTVRERDELLRKMSEESSIIGENDLYLELQPLSFFKGDMKSMKMISFTSWKNPACKPHL